MIFRACRRFPAVLRKSFASVSAVAVALSGTYAFVHSAKASDETVIEISIKDHKFEPSAIKLPTGKPIKISVKNLDPSAEEFESTDLGFEKVIAGNSDATIRLKPLEAGTYIFYGEYHEDTALGHIVAE
jgi:plastocyanin